MSTFQRSNSFWISYHFCYGSIMCRKETFQFLYFQQGLQTSLRRLGLNFFLFSGFISRHIQFAGSNLYRSAHRSLLNCIRFWGKKFTNLLKMLRLYQIGWFSIKMVTFYPLKVSFNFVTLKEKFWWDVTLSKHLLSLIEHEVALIGFECYPGFVYFLHCGVFVLLWFNYFYNPGFTT